MLGHLRLQIVYICGLQHWHYQFEATTCPPWDLEGKHTEKKGGLFPHPPTASEFKSHVRLRPVLSSVICTLLRVNGCRDSCTSCPNLTDLHACMRVC
jgi:hypothetical protein